MVARNCCAQKLAPRAKKRNAAAQLFPVITQSPNQHDDVRPGYRSRFPVLNEEYITGPPAHARARWLRRTACLVLVHFPALHHKHHLADIGDVNQRIAVGGDQVGFHPGRDTADLVAEAKRLSGSRRRTYDRVHGRLAGVAHAIDELFAVEAVAARHGVRTEHDLHSLGHGFAYRPDADRQIFRHQRESMFSVIAEAEKGLLVIQVIVHVRQVGIQISAMLRHEIQNLVAEECSVLDAGASCQDLSLGATRCVGVYGRAASLPPGFAATALYLLLPHYLLASTPAAPR